MDLTFSFTVFDATTRVSWFSLLGLVCIPSTLSFCYFSGKRKNNKCFCSWPCHIRAFYPRIVKITRCSEKCGNSCRSLSYFTHQLAASMCFFWIRWVCPSWWYEVTEVFGPVYIIYPLRNEVWLTGSWRNFAFLFDL